MLLCDSDAVVFETQFHAICCLGTRNRQHQIPVGVLDGVVHQIEDHVAQMHPVRVNQRLFSFQFQLHFPAVFAHLNGHVFDHLADEVVHIQGLFEELHFARFCQTGLQDILHQHAEPLVLLVDQTDVVVKPVGILLHVGVLEGFRRQTNGADGGFELVREVVHQIPADSVDAFVACCADDRGKKAPGNDGQHEPG